MVHKCVKYCAYEDDHFCFDLEANAYKQYRTYSFTDNSPLDHNKPSYLISNILSSPLSFHSLAYIIFTNLNLYLSSCPTS